MDSPCRSFDLTRQPFLKVALTTSAVLAALVRIAMTGESPSPLPPDRFPERLHKKDSFVPSHTCENCHTRLYEQQIESVHAKASTDPIFQAHYFKDVLPRVKDGLRFFKEARSCAACHMPVAYKNSGARIVTKESIDPEMSGVTCDLCHRIRAHTAPQPGNGNFIASPGPEKYGPFKTAGTWHHVYCELQTKSEFCAICHQAVNQLGVEVKPTYTEWKKSRYAEQGIQCQDCHMSKRGFLKNGRSVFESGKAADMVLGEAPERRVIYSHNFPGARTGQQLENALTLELESADAAVRPGQTMALKVKVSNANTGHGMPSGSIELRYMWLDLQAKSGGTSYPIAAVQREKEQSYDVTGAMASDARSLGDSFPNGRRIYRAVFLDEDGEQTHSSVDAARKVYDNRLTAGEVRTEDYTWRVPDAVTGAVEISATLNYEAYPVGFADWLEVPRAKTTCVTTAQRTIAVRP